MEVWKRIAKRSREKEKFVVFIGCGKKKRLKKTTAEKLYIGSFFKLCLNIAKTISTEDTIYILSARYGVVNLSTLIEPYQLKVTSSHTTHNTEKLIGQKDWVPMVKKQIQKLPSYPKIFICPSQYHSAFKGVKVLPKLGIGYQMQWMQKILDRKPKLCIS
jgi:cytoplasmic iron level regulating protein YaaA (DUF328/UPF0246 family)